VRGSKGRKRARRREYDNLYSESKKKRRRRENDSVCMIRARRREKEPRDGRLWRVNLGHREALVERDSRGSMDGDA